MAADNAIIIGMVAANFAPKNRKQIIMWGVFAAFIFRVIFAFSATFLLQFAFIKLIGGALLLWIVNELRIDLFTVKKIKSPTKQSKEPSFMSGVYKVLIADITLSFDNVLGVAGAAKVLGLAEGTGAGQFNCLTRTGKTITDAAKTALADIKNPYSSGSSAVDTNAAVADLAALKAVAATETDGAYPNAGKVYMAPKTADGTVIFVATCIETPCVATSDTTVGNELTVGD